MLDNRSPTAATNEQFSNNAFTGTINQVPSTLRLPIWGNATTMMTNQQTNPPN